MMTLITIAVLLIAAYLGLKLWFRVPDMRYLDKPEAELIKPDSEISQQHEDILRLLESYHSAPTVKDIDIGRQRFLELFSRSTDIPYSTVDVSGMPAEWICAPGSDPDSRLLYIHGGAFVVGSPASHRYIAGELSRRAGVSVLSIDYRMQPEFKLTQCHQDARMGYEWILDHGPDGNRPPYKLFVAGDSAGGNLTLSVLAWAKQKGLRAADGAVTFAPLTDASFSSPTWAANIETDYFLGPSIGRVLKIPAVIRNLASRLQGGLAVNDPVASPLLGDLKALPPTLIQVSRDEMLYGDARRYANKARQSGSEVTLQVWPKLVHVFQAFSELPESSEALDLAAEFIRQRI